MSETGITFALLLAGVAAFVGGLFLYAWQRRNRRALRPTHRYREWKDN